uniref:Uncharacterized protein n=1 Tax=Timema cristinae TaxID=61476 RepID=A0A7R9DEK4_TIMCR|nr:unnamed protein product [Timema cristinae]
MANIFDLLGSAKKTSQINDNISLPYIFYHKKRNRPDYVYAHNARPTLLMHSLCMYPHIQHSSCTVSACIHTKHSAQQTYTPSHPTKNLNPNPPLTSSTVKHRSDTTHDQDFNLDLLNISSLVYCESSALDYATIEAEVIIALTFQQLFMAMIISTVYGLVMMAVVVGIALQIKEDGPLAPASMFFFVFAGELIIAGLLHPREINCLPAMLIYYITVPSMYMLLILYSLFNMNNISWGTREAPVAPGADKTKKEIEEEKKKAEEEAKLKKKKKPFFGFLQGNNKSPEEEGSIEFSLAGLFKCMLCTHPKSVDDKLQLARIAESINSIGRRIEMIERRIDPTAPSRRRGSMSINGHTVSLQEEPEEEDSYSDSIEDMGGRGMYWHIMKQSYILYRQYLGARCACYFNKL